MLRSVLRVAVLGGRRSSLSFAPLIDPIGRSGTKHHRASLWRCQYSSTTKLAALVRDGNHQHDNSDVAQHTNADNCATPFDRDPSVETAAAAFRAIIKKQRQKVEERARKAATLAAMQADRNAVVPSLTNGTDATTTTTTTTSSTSNLTAQVDDGTVPDTAGDLAAVEVFEASKLQPEEVEDYVLPPLEQCLRSPPSLTQDARLSIAPMMEVTNNHFRFIMRMLTRRTLMYTEMNVDQCLIFSGKRDQFLEYDASAHPIVLQLGGSQTKKLTQALEVSLPYGYDEINLNCGCPSPKVSGEGCFGASLMLEPMQVARITQSMLQLLAAKGLRELPVTVKCRLGVDRFDSYDFIRNFIEVVSTYGGVTHFIIHARKAFLKGLNPAQNRTVPPLMYDRVFQLVHDFPHLQFTLNGGVHTIEEIREHLNHGIIGVMIGRESMNRPWMFANVDTQIFGESSNPGFTRREILTRYADYAQEQMTLHREKRAVLLRPIINLFNGEHGSTIWRRALDREVVQTKTTTIREAILKAMSQMPDSSLDALPPS